MDKHNYDENYDNTIATPVHATPAATQESLMSLDGPEIISATQEATNTEGEYENGTTGFAVSTATGPWESEDDQLLIDLVLSYLKDIPWKNLAEKHFPNRTRQAKGIYADRNNVCKEIDEFYIQFPNVEHDLAKRFSSARKPLHISQETFGELTNPNTI
ncbi:2878_t:CDS:2 [Diversispora eburnea]|uniref:2878_t:CDS:1 n=1 Tax=Diversispora eburnea TaxID=1213867 RepID=A0A9N8YVJ9_9GLOM|nr:2878_t:CDS:2 [Diversispora eburnea]